MYVGLKRLFAFYLMLLVTPKGLLEEKDLYSIIRLGSNYRVALARLDDAIEWFNKGKREKSRNLFGECISAIKESLALVDEFGVSIKPPKGFPDFPNSFGPGMKAFVTKDEDVISKEDSVILVEIEDSGDVYQDRIALYKKKLARGRKSKSSLDYFGAKTLKMLANLYTVDRSFRGYFYYRAKILDVYSVGKGPSEFLFGKRDLRKDLVPGKEISLRCFEERFVGPDVRLKNGEDYWVVITPPKGTELIEMLAGVGDSWIEYVEKAKKEEAKNFNGKVIRQVKILLKEVVKKEKRILGRAEEIFKSSRIWKEDRILDQILELKGDFNSLEKKINRVFEESGLFGLCPPFPKTFDQRIISYLEKDLKIWKGGHSLIKGRIEKFGEYLNPSKKIKKCFPGNMYYLDILVENVFLSPKKGSFLEGRVVSPGKISPGIMIKLAYFGEDAGRVMGSMDTGKEFWLVLSPFVPVPLPGIGQKMGKNEMARLLFAEPVQIRNM